jgi:hypothetical protein
VIIDTGTMKKEHGVPKMASKSYEIFTCDRCKKEEHIAGNMSPDHWGKVWYAQNNGPLYSKMKFPQYQRDCSDLCDDCLIVLDKWYNLK